MYLTIVLGLTLVFVTSCQGFWANIQGLRTVPDGDVVVYDNVVFQYDNAYDKTTGIFTAPESGEYVVTLSVESQPEKEAYLLLYQNDEVVDFVYSNLPNNNDTALIKFSLQLEAGDILFVKSMGESYIGGDPKNPNLGFGVYLKEI